MFVEKPTNVKWPIKIWVEEKGKIEESCLEQAYHLANLPFLHKWVCLMPDTHTGKGMPIGGVIATDGVVIPNAVGVDIGCGMIFTATNIKAASLDGIMTGNGSLLQAIISKIMREIPVGYNRYKQPQVSNVLDEALQHTERYDANEELMPLLKDAYYQVGTLGGGNHFIDLQ